MKIIISNMYKKERCDFERFGPSMLNTSPISFHLPKLPVLKVGRIEVSMKNIPHRISKMDYVTVNYYLSKYA